MLLRSHSVQQTEHGENLDADLLDQAKAIVAGRRPFAGAACLMRDLAISVRRITFWYGVAPMGLANVE